MSKPPKKQRDRYFDHADWSFIPVDGLNKYGIPALEADFTRGGIVDQDTAFANSGGAMRALESMGIRETQGRRNTVVRITTPHQKTVHIVGGTHIVKFAQWLEKHQNGDGRNEHILEAIPDRYKNLAPFKKKGDAQQPPAIDEKQLLLTESPATAPAPVEASPAEVAPAQTVLPPVDELRAKVGMPAQDNAIAPQPAPSGQMEIPEFVVEKLQPPKFDDGHSDPNHSAHVGHVTRLTTMKAVSTGGNRKQREVPPHVPDLVDEAERQTLIERVAQSLASRGLGTNKGSGGRGS